MKHGKKPTVKQAQFLSDKGFNHDCYLIVKDTPTTMEIVHRYDGTKKVLLK